MRRARAAAALALCLAATACADAMLAAPAQVRQPSTALLAEQNMTQRLRVERPRLAGTRIRWHCYGGSGRVIPAVYVVDGHRVSREEVAHLRRDDVTSLTFHKDAATLARYGASAGEEIVAVFTTRGGGTR